MAEQKKKRPRKAAPKPQLTDKPEVVYVQPEALNRKKIAVRLLTVAAVVVALFVGFSIFFRVENIVISGNQKYNAWTIREVSGIKEGDSLLTFGKSKACGKIVQSLPYVKVVRIGIKLPGTVNIYIEEVEMVYSVQDQNNSWWLMTSEGRLVEKTGGKEAAKHTKILGFVLDSPKVGQKAVALEPKQEDEKAEEDETVVVTTNADRLSLALEIMSQLEHNQIIGEVASIDVSQMGDIQLWYGDKYHVFLGGPSNLMEKIEDLKAAVSRNDITQYKIIDLTYTTTEGALLKK